MPLLTHTGDIMATQLKKISFFSEKILVQLKRCSISVCDMHAAYNSYRGYYGN